MRKFLLAAAAILSTSPAMADTYPVTLRVTDGSGASSDQSFNIDVSAASGGASGWVTIPATTLPGSGISVPSFRVMKHLARGSNPPTSTPTGSPTYVGNLAAARTYCQTLGAGFDVLTISQYLAIAHNALQQEENWTGIVVGSGSFMSGMPANPVAASSDDAQGYTGITAGAGSDKYRRTWLLSNGGVIWDLAAQGSSWGPQVLICDQPRPGCNSSGQMTPSAFLGTSASAGAEWTAMTTIPSGNSDIKPLSYNTTQNVGKKEVTNPGGVLDPMIGYNGVFGMGWLAYNINYAHFRCAGPLN